MRVLRSIAASLMFTPWILAPLTVAGCTAPGHDTSRADSLPPKLVWRSIEPDAVAALDAGGQLLFELRHGPAEDEPALHPVGLPGGPSLTRDRPADHAWHHGIWFAWKFLDGVNYWEHGPDGRPVGRTSWSAPQLDVAADGTARLDLELAYGHAVVDPTNADATDVRTPTRLREWRELVVHPPDPDGAWALDWSSRFEAVTAPVTLDRTPLPGEPGGVIYGGYAGLSVRLIQLADRQVNSPQGPVGFDAGQRARPEAAALDYAGRPDDSSGLAGIAVIEHAHNPVRPRRWYVIRSDTMSFFTPAVLTAGPLVVEPGTPLHLAWRIVVHPDAWSPERLERESERYANGLPPGH